MKKIENIPLKLMKRYEYFKDFIKEVEEKYEILSLKVNEQFEARAENCFDSETFRKLLSLRTTQIQSMEFIGKIKIILDTDSNYDIGEIHEILNDLKVHHLESIRLCCETHELPFGKWLYGDQTLH